MNINNPPEERVEFEFNIMGHRIKGLALPTRHNIYIPTGTHNGYVQYYEPVDYNSLPFEVHGGLTFSGSIKGYEGHWIGFDTCHFQDGPHCDLDFVRDECLKLAEQVVLHEIDKGVRSTYEKIGQ